MRAHALLGASSSKMWLNCPGSARLNEMFPDTESSYALEGTVAHRVAEVIVKNSGKKGHEELKAIKAQYPDILNPEMNDHCTAYAKYVWDLPGQLLVEQRLDYSGWVPEGFGTGDALKVNDDVLHVIDFKYGKGKKVEAEDNTQLMLYALGAYGALNMIYDFERIVVHIFQPRLGDPTVAEFTVDELLDWADGIVPIAQKAFDGVEEYHSGDHCQWCKAKPTCKTRMQEQAAAAFEGMMVEPEETIQIPNQMTEAEIVYWLKWVGPLTKWLGDLKKYAEDQAINHGVNYEGYKVVEGRSNRTYSNEETVIDVLLKAGLAIDQIMKPQELLGITALEKNLGKKSFGTLVEPLLIKPPGKPTLVPLSDKRDPINSLEKAREAFND